MGSDVGFHEGELAVQRRAGVSTQAARLSGMMAPTQLRDGASRFLAGRDTAFLSARDRVGRLWISPLLGPPGFLDGQGTTLRIATRPRPGDPLADLPVGQPVGLLAIDFPTRRRLRVNGMSTGSDPLEIEVEQAYGNCPQYIHPHRLAPAASASATTRWSTALAPAQARLIERADTFLLGTAHPRRGLDASHRGGEPGFVHVEDGQLWWPDYAGNNVFNSLGNLAVNDEAALLFLDFATGTTLHLSGTASVQWTPSSTAEARGDTGRRVRFDPRHILERGP